MNTNPNNGGFSYKGKENYLQVNTEDSSRIEGRYSPVQNCINTGSFFFTPCRLTFKSKALNYCYKTKEYSQTIKGAHVQVLWNKRNRICNVTGELHKVMKNVLASDPGTKSYSASFLLRHD